MSGTGRWFFVGLVAAPCVVLVASRLVLSKPGPAGAIARSPNGAEGPQAGPVVSFAAQDRSLALAQAWQGYTPPITYPSPFYQPKTIVDERPEEPLVAPPREPDLPNVALTAVMGGRRPVAVVDGRMLSIGDEAAEGWIIAVIDPSQQVIKIEANGGRSLIVAVGGHLR